MNVEWFQRFRDIRLKREAELDSELNFHLRELADAKIAEGLTPEEARRQAQLEFGGNAQVREVCRDIHRMALLDGALMNLKSALRFIRKAPGFSITVVLTLALGVGANSAVFSAIDAIILRALPYPEADRLVMLHQYSGNAKGSETNVAAQRLEDWNRLARGFSGITGYYTQDSSETSGLLPEKLSQALVAPRFLEVLGVPPALGRGFSPEEERFGGPNAVLISHAYWERRFHGDPQVTGKKLHFGHYAATIIGVMPASFSFPDRNTDLWGISAADAPYAQDRNQTWFFAFGRLAPGIIIDQGRAALATAQTELGRQYPKTDKDIRVGVQPLKDSIVGGSETSLWLMFGSVSLLLLIACMNIAALLLARTAERAREIAIRYSLGAGRSSIVWQLLTESFLLASIGSAAGLAVAVVASRVFRSLAASLPRADEIKLDSRILLYVLGCALLCTLVFGLVPALQATRRTPGRSLAANSRTQIAGGNALQWILVGGQVCLAVALLVGAALLLRSFQALGRVSPGFDASHVLTLRLSGSWGETADMKTLIRRMDGDLDAIRSVPGVAGAATSASLPGVASAYPVEFKLSEGGAVTDRIVSDAKAVSGGYFETMSIPLLSGKACGGEKPLTTAVVNRSFANMYLGTRSPVGLHLELLHDAFFQRAQEIIGVVTDAHEDGLRRSPGPIVYSCISAPDPSPFFLIRTAGNPALMGLTLRKKLGSVEPGRSVFDITPLDQVLSGASSEDRLRTLLLSVFALTAILLAAIGLYGTLSYFVNVRRREVGLRMAVGALPSQILKRFLRQGVGVALLGCVGGLMLAAALSRLLAGVLYGTSRLDATSYTAVAVLVVAVAAAASVIPATRAARLEPMRTLRDE